MASISIPTEDRLLRPGQVAAIFGVKLPAVRCWGESHKLTVLRTLGGHRRYRESEVLSLKAALTTPATPVPALAEAAA